LVLVLISNSKFQDIQTVAFEAANTNSEFQASISTSKHYLREIKGQTLLWKTLPLPNSNKDNFVNKIETSSSAASILIQTNPSLIGGQLQAQEWMARSKKV